MDNLLPCPFCGGEATVQTTRHGYPPMHWVRCVPCEASAGAFHSRESAAKAWNSRNLQCGHCCGSGVNECGQGCALCKGGRIKLPLLGVGG